MSTFQRTLAVTLAAACLAGCAAEGKRSEAEFKAAAAEFSDDLVADYTEIRRITIEAAERKLQAWRDGDRDRQPTLDILILSAGGADGAFGAGFLQGWGEYYDPTLARPRFDRVTGVSTGALMAPYAMIGTDEAYATLADLYANPSPSWVKGSALLAVLGGKPALMNNSGLNRLVREQITPDILTQIAPAVDNAGIMLVGATNLDLGRFRVFDLTKVAAEGNEKLFEDIILASSAIPGVFPPVEVEGWNYTDGAAVANLFLGVDRDLIWREEGGPWWDAERDAELGTPKLRVRHWVIVNGKLRLDDEQIELKWSSVGRRGLQQLIQAANIRSLQQLEVMRRLASRRPDVEFEIYWVAIPPEADLPESNGMFDKTYMRALLELGRTMGRDPSSWHTESPLLELDWNRTETAGQ